MAYIAIAVVIVLVLGLIVLGRVEANRLGRTPFQVAIQLAESRGRSGSTGGGFDVFVSYKSEDSVIARHLAEQFVAAGLAPWLAEYVIPIHKRVEFMKAIELGVQNARLGLCLTNRRYFESDICRYELEQLSLPQNRASQGLVALELAEVDHRLRDEAPWQTRVKFESLPQAVEALGSCLGFRSPSASIFPEPVDGDRQRFHAPNATYSLNLSGWDVTRRRSNAGGGDVWGPAFQRWFGSFLMWGHLVVGPQDPRIRRRCMATGAFDDREYYEEALRFADGFFKMQLPQRCVGVHLLFLGGWSHVALTTFVNSTWSRIYSLVFPDPKGGPDVEYAFFFFAREPFRDFCLHAHAMDELVLSLEIDQQVP